MTTKTKRLSSFLICIFVTMSTAIIAIDGMLNGPGVGQLGTNMRGLNYFQAFTIDSNIFCAITLGIVGIYDLRWLLSRKKCRHSWVTTLQLMGASSTAVTMLTVFLFLIPSAYLSGGNPWAMVEDDMLFFHVLNPLLASINFFFFRWKKSMQLRECIFATLPLAIYGAIYGLMVLVFGIWSDFYGLTFGGNSWLGTLAITILILVAFATNCFLSFASPKNTKSSSPKKHR